MGAAMRQSAAKDGMGNPAMSNSPAALARLGLLGVYTLLARRAARPARDPSLACEAGLALRSERFGVRTRLPDGRKSASEEALRIDGYGELALLDVEVETLGGSRACLLAAIEPAPPAPGAIELATRVFALPVGARMGGSGQGVLCEEGAGPGESREVTVTGADGTMEASRIFVVGSRVICASALFAAGDHHAERDLRRFLHVLAVDADGEKKKKPSGTYVAIGGGRGEDD